MAVSGPIEGELVNAVLLNESHSDLSSLVSGYPENTGQVHAEKISYCVFLLKPGDRHHASLKDVVMVDQESQNAGMASIDEEEVLHLPELSLRVRITLLILGWLMVLLGIIGIFLPILQGFAFIFIGLVMLSIASERVHGWLEKLLRRSPGIQQRYQRLRQRLHLKFSREK